MATNHYLELALENQKSIKGQLDYAIKRLDSDIQDWEKKEYSNLIKELEVELESVNYRVKKCIELCD